MRPASWNLFFESSLKIPKFILWFSICVRNTTWMNAMVLTARLAGQYGRSAAAFERGLRPVLDGTRQQVHAAKIASGENLAGRDLRAGNCAAKFFPMCPLLLNDGGGRRELSASTRREAS